MKKLLLGCGAMIAMAASPASAADWWMLSRPPVGNVALFADEDTIARESDGSVSLLVLRIDRAGRSTETMEWFSCARPARFDDVLSQFACAMPDERENYGLILGSITPAEAARMLFDMGPTKAEPRDDRL